MRVDLRRRVGGVLVERLLLEQPGDQRLELVAVLGQQRRDLLVALLDDPLHLEVDQPLRLL